MGQPKVKRRRTGIVRSETKHGHAVRGRERNEKIDRDDGSGDGLMSIDSCRIFNLVKDDWLVARAWYFVEQQMPNYTKSF